jgi:hypothetical protein
MNALNQSRARKEAGGDERDGRKVFVARAIFMNASISIDYTSTGIGSRATAPRRLLPAVRSAGYDKCQLRLMLMDH